MRSRTIIRWVAVTGTATLLLAACSGGGEDTAKGDTGPVTMASIMGLPERTNSDIISRDMLIQEGIAKCMMAQGWEYIPWVIGEMPAMVEVTPESERERIEREGLEAAYQYLVDDNLGSDPNEIIDPNSPYLETLSLTQSDAYNTSLKGSYEEHQALIVYETDPYTGDLFQSNRIYLGCTGQAMEELDQKYIPGSWEYQELMDDYYAEIADRVAADPRMVEFTKNWSACMNKAGFDFASEWEYWASGHLPYFARAEAVVEAGRNVDPMAGWTQDERDQFFATASDEEREALYALPSTLTADQRSQLEEILAEEVVLGLAGWTCSYDVPATSVEIYAQIEATYALEHQDELEALAVTLGIGQ